MRAAATEWRSRRAARGSQSRVTRMDLRVFIAACVISAASVALVTFAGDRAQRAMRGGVSRLGLLIGLTAGGAIVTVFDLFLAYLVMAFWNDVVAPGLGLGAVALLTPFVFVAVAHIWSTLALARRRWTAAPVPIERDPFR